MVNVVVFKSPDIFAEFGRVLVFSVAERCSVVSVMCLEVVFCESNIDVCFRSAVIVTRDGGLVNN